MMMPIVPLDTDPPPTGVAEQDAAMPTHNSVDVCMHASNLLFDWAQRDQMLLCVRVGNEADPLQCVGLLPVLIQTSDYFKLLIRESLRDGAPFSEIHILALFRVRSQPDSASAFRYAWSILNGAPTRHLTQTLWPEQQIDSPVSLEYWQTMMPILRWLKHFGEYLRANAVVHRWYVELWYTLRRSEFLWTGGMVTNDRYLPSPEQTTAVQYLQECIRMWPKTPLTEHHRSQLIMFCNLMERRCEIPTCTHAAQVYRTRTDNSPFNRRHLRQLYGVFRCALHCLHEIHLSHNALKDWLKQCVTAPQPADDDLCLVDSPMVSVARERIAGMAVRRMLSDSKVQVWIGFKMEAVYTAAERLITIAVNDFTKYEISVLTLAPDAGCPRDRRRHPPRLLGHLGKVRMLNDLSYYCRSIQQRIAETPELARFVSTIRIDTSGVGVPLDTPGMGEAQEGHSSEEEDEDHQE